MERSDAVLALAVDVRASGQQELRHLDVSVLGRQMKRGESLDKSRRSTRGLISDQVDGLPTTWSYFQTTW